MPLIGDTTRFAVEFELDDNYAGVWLYGKVCYWICNQQIGDYNQGTSLRDFLFQIEQGRRDNGLRNNSRFDCMSAKDIATIIDDAFFIGNNPQNEILSREECWGRHNLVPAIDTFDRWAIYLVETKLIARLIYCNLDVPEVVTECILLPGECDRVLNQVCEILGKIYQVEESLVNNLS